MSTNLGPGNPETSDRSRQSTTVVAGGSIAQAATAAGAAVLAIIGLLGEREFLMMSLATIALGIAFLLREGGLVTQFLRSAHLSRAESIIGQAFGRGVTAATLAGITAVTLGILALADVDPTILVPAAIIVFGGALLFDHQAGNPLSPFLSHGIETPPNVGNTAVGGELLVGVGAATMGIVALVGDAPVTLSLVALLALGISTFLVGGAFGTKLMTSAR